MMELNLNGNRYALKQEQPDDQLSESKSCFGEILAAGLFMDVKLMCGGVEVPAHKAVLWSRVPFFKDALMHDPTESDTLEIPPEISPGAVWQIVQYAYFIQPMVTLENAQDLFEAAAFFRIEDLWAFCDQFIAKRILLTEENCLAVQNYAVVRSAKNLQRKTEAFILVHLANIGRTNAFRSISEGDIMSILNVKDAYGVPKETVFWELLLRWIEGDAKNRKPVMSSLLGLLRLPSLRADVITKEVLPYPCITSDPACQQMVHKVLQYKADPGNAEIKQECGAVFSLQPRCNQTDRLYHFGLCQEQELEYGCHVQIDSLHNPDAEAWAKKCWTGFPAGHRANFRHVVAIDYVVYCITSADGALLSYNTVMESWTVIQADAGRPDLLKMRGFCSANGKLVAACGPTCDYKQLLICCYDPTSNSWQQNTLNGSRGLSEGNSITCCGVTSCDIGHSDNGSDMLCMFDIYSGPMLVDVESGNIVKNGRTYIDPDDEVDGDEIYITADWFDGFGIASFNGKVFLAGRRSVKVYDLALDDWSSLPNLNVLTNVHDLVVANGHLFAIDETSGGPDIEYSVEYIDLTDNTSQWQHGPKFTKHCFIASNSFFVACQYHP